MRDPMQPDYEELPPDLQLISDEVVKAAKSRDNDVLALLWLLRLLEQLHRDICETQFQAALPTNRQRLYALLRDIETSGGWPYIQRMKLRSLLENLESTEWE